MAKDYYETLTVDQDIAHRTANAYEAITVALVGIQTEMKEQTYQSEKHNAIYLRQVTLLETQLAVQAKLSADSAALSQILASQMDASDENPGSASAETAEPAKEYPH